MFACVQQVDDPSGALYAEERNNYNNQQRPQSSSHQRSRGGHNGPGHMRRRSTADINMGSLASTAPRAAAAAVSDEEHKAGSSSMSVQSYQEADASRSQISRFENEFTEQVLSHALKLKKKCKELKAQLAEAINLRKEQEEISQRQLLEHQGVCDAIVAQLRAVHSKVLVGDCDVRALYFSVQSVSDCFLFAC